MKIKHIMPGIIVSYVDGNGNERIAIHRTARTVLSNYGLTNPRQWTPEELSNIVNDYDVAAYQMRIDVLNCKMDYGIAYGEILQRERREAKIKEETAKNGYCSHPEYIVARNGTNTCVHCDAELDKETP
jgi:hypothetical protein